MDITEVIYMVILLAVGFGMGWLYAKAHTLDDYNHMYSYLTCEIISRMQKAMRSMRMEQDDIDRVIDRMGCKIMPASVPPPPTPPEKPARGQVSDIHSPELRESKDERMMRIIMNALIKAPYSELDGLIPDTIRIWLERKINQWKPSEEQMRVLDLAIRCGINRGTTEETTLVSLFNDLVKLK